MSVRWKPLIILSGIFLLVGVVGLCLYALAPGDAGDVLPLARAEWKAKKYDRALIQFRRALQKDPKNAEIQEQLAAMYGEWAEAVPARRDELRPMRLRALAEAAKFGKQRAEPRRLLLADALAHDELADAVHWAEELVALDPKAADAHYALALKALDSGAASLSEARLHLEALEAAEPKRARTLWVKAQIAREVGDATTLDATLAEARNLAVARDADPVDRLAMLQVHLIDAERADAPADLAARVKAVRDAAETLAGDPEAAPSRIARVGRLLDALRRTLVARGQADPKRAADAEVAVLEEAVEAIYKKATGPGASPDPRMYLAYAEHLLQRDRRDACLDVVARGLALPLAKKSSWDDVAMSLREAGVKAALLDGKDPKRYDKAAPFIKDLLASTDAVYKGIGHLFQGVIDLERSGMTDPSSARGDAARATDAGLRTSALKHLKASAAALPKSSTAQALYGVALLLSGESALGRQYLQGARQLGNLEARYQVWVAWSMIQSGYPEEAAPIVDRMLRQVAATPSASAVLGPMLHLLRGEIHQARGTRADLEVARAEYQKATPAGQKPSPSLELRLAQVELMLGDKEAGSRRLEQLRAARTGPAAEALAVLMLKEQKQDDEARKRLAEARAAYPDSDELANLQAAMLANDGKAEEADKVLAAFLAKHPDHLDARLTRARLLSNPPLDRFDEAAKLLSEAADGDNSSPLVALAELEIRRKRYDEAARVISRIKARWKELSTADLLDAQLALAQDDPRSAAAHLDDALRKDPTNRLALFYKARLDAAAGAEGEAARIYEELAREGTSKPFADGVTVGQAAELSLASLALKNRDIDGAIGRYKGLLGSGLGADASREVRWLLAAAQAAKGQLPEAKAAVAQLLADPATTANERVQAANFYRQNNEPKLALQQLDAVLKDRPGHPQAVASKALLLTNDGKAGEAADLIRKAIAAEPQPPTLYLMLASTENLTPPAATGPDRTIRAIDGGLKVHAESADLVRARYLAMKLKNDPAALGFVEEHVKAHPAPALRRLLVDTYRDEGRLDRAEAAVRDLLKESPRDATLAANLIALVIRRAAEAGERGDRAAAKAAEGDALAQIRKYRKDLPNDPRFPQAEFDLAFLRNDLDRALSLTEEIDALTPNAPTGPMLRARIYAAKGWTSQVAKAYGEAVDRSPRRLDARIALAQANLALNQPDEALRQAEFVLKDRPEDADARLLRARALAIQPGTPEQVAARREQALASLRAAVKADPKAAAFYREIADIERLIGRRDAAVKTLRDGLAAAPGDEDSLLRLAEFLVEPGPDGKAPTAEQVAAAARLVEPYAAADKDASGTLALALAMGFQKGRQYDLALSWAEKAAAKLDRPFVHLTVGDILLSKAEATADEATARAVFERAAGEYDRVLAQQANSVEATNNKAWILHRYLGQDKEALALAEGLLQRSDADSLPPEFLDTLGSIQEAMKKTADAESTYARGLQKAPEFAMLNYHMGRLIAADRDRAGKAVEYLRKAQKGRETLPVTAAREVDTLLERVGR